MYPSTFLKASGEKVEAMQITEETIQYIAAWTDGEVMRFTQPLASGTINWVGIRFTSRDGATHARLGEWIVKDPTQLFQFRSYPDRVFRNFFNYI